MSTKELRNEARKAHTAGDLQRAEELYRKLLREAGHAGDATNLGSLLRAVGRLEEAISLYKEWVAVFPEDLTLRLNAINSAIEKGDTKQSHKWINNGFDYHPQNWELEKAVARTLIREGNFKKSIEILEALSTQKPNDVGIWMDIALSHHHMEQWSSALSALNNALTLNPNNPRIYCNILSIYKTTGQWKQARDLLKTLSKKLRESLPILSAEADLALAQREFQQAQQLFAELCKREPSSPLHWLNQCASLRGLRRPVKACKVIKQGISIHPKHSLLRKALAQALAEQGKQVQTKSLLLEDIRGTKDTPLKQKELFNLQFLGSGYQLIDAKELSSIAQVWEEEVKSLGIGELWGDRINDTTKKRKIRVGYLSADFCNHPVGRFILPLLQKHDKGMFEIIAFSCGAIEDEVKEQLRGQCKHWIDLRHKSSLEGARIISDMQIDVIIELGGYTAESRLDFLCHKPCKHQLSYLGYFAPTYLKSIDGWIGDEILFGKLSEIDKNEKLMMIKGGYMAFPNTNLQEIKAINRNSEINIGCFNHSRKLTRESIYLFAKTIKSVGAHSTLVLKSISFTDKEEQQRIKDEFNSAGLSDNQLKLLPCTNTHDQHLDCYNIIDIALDPIPYGGATTTCEALTMGVPVVTLTGRGMVRRLSSSILAHAGCSEWITENEADFINTCISLSKSGVRTVKDRKELRNKVMASQLCDSKRLAGEMERLISSLVSYS